MLQESIHSWRLVAKPQGEIDSADSFILLGFGLVQTDGGLAPGASNEALAQWLLANNPQRKPTITQLGTELAVRQQLEIKGDSAEFIVPLPHNDNVHVDTHGAALQIWLLAQQHNFQRPCLVTHPLQSERARRIFQKLPFETLIVPPITASTIPMTPNSVQRWTRTELNYTIFERVLARPIGRIFGWL